MNKTPTKPSAIILMVSCLVLFSVLFFTNKTHAQQLTLLNTGTTNDIRDVHFASADTGYFLSNSAIRKTVNGGQSFQLLTAPTTKTYTKVFAASGKLVYVAGLDGFIIKSLDGGLNWTDISINTTEDIFGMQFILLTNGFVCGTGGMFAATNIGGMTWRIRKPNTFETLNADQFFDAQKGIVVGNNGKVFKTRNQGSSWNTHFPQVANFNDLSFINENEGWIFGVSNPYCSIQKTIDGCQNWIDLPYAFTNNISTGHFFDASNGIFVWAVGANSTGSIKVTSNGGLNWSNLLTPAAAQVEKLHFPTSQVGYLVGLNGVAYKYSRTSSVSELNNSILIKVYPNPVSNQLKIEGLTLGEEIIITDILGKIIYKSIASNTETTIDNLTTNGNLILSIKNKEQKVIYHKVILSINN